MTICFLLRTAEDGSRLVCLAKKKRGFREGKINGYGGKLEAEETLLECALRETQEEAGIKPINLDKVAEVFFHDPGLTHECHVFVCNQWEGEPTETEEMLPDWYPVEEIPFERMGQADSLWIPPVLRGRRVRASFYYTEENEMFDPSVEPLGEGEEFCQT